MTTIAYLDAGSGSMMLQALLAGAAGLAVMVRVWGARFKRAVFFWRDDDADGTVGIGELEQETAEEKAPPRT